MFKKLAVSIGAMAVLSASAATGDRMEVQDVIALQDGSTVYVFGDGKMAMEDRYGRSVYRRPGTVLAAKDGSQVTMRRSDPMRIDIMKRQYPFSGFY